MASVRLVWLVMRVGLLRRYLGQIYTDSRPNNGLRNRLPTTLTGIAQMLLQYGTIFWFIKISDHLNGISGVFELDKDVADAEYIYRHILQLASVQSLLCPPLTQ